VWVNGRQVLGAFRGPTSQPIVKIYAADDGAWTEVWPRQPEVPTGLTITTEWSEILDAQVEIFTWDAVPEHADRYEVRVTYVGEDGPRGEPPPTLSPMTVYVVADAETLSVQGPALTNKILWEGRIQAQVRAVSDLSGRVSAWSPLVTERRSAVPAVGAPEDVGVSLSGGYLGFQAHVPGTRRVTEFVIDVHRMFSYAEGPLSGSPPGVGGWLDYGDTGEEEGGPPTPVLAEGITSTLLRTIRIPAVTSGGDVPEGHYYIDTADVFAPLVSGYFPTNSLWGGRVLAFTVRTDGPAGFGVASSPQIVVLPRTPSQSLMSARFLGGKVRAQWSTAEPLTSERWTSDTESVDFAIRLPGAADPPLVEASVAWASTPWLSDDSAGVTDVGSSYQVWVTVTNGYGSSAAHLLGTYMKIANPYYVTPTQTGVIVNGTIWPGDSLAVGFGAGYLWRGVAAYGSKFTALRSSALGYSLNISSADVLLSNSGGAYPALARPNIRKHPFSTLAEALAGGASGLSGVAASNDPIPSGVNGRVVWRTLPAGWATDLVQQVSGWKGLSLYTTDTSTRSGEPAPARVVDYASYHGMSVQKQQAAEGLRPCMTVRIYHDG
jgi:hypothetical protein